MSCIFCKTENELTDEHVFPAALGGRAELKAGTCKDCNNKFSRAFEEKINRAFIPIRNILFIPDRRGEVPRVCAQVVVEGRVRRARILPGGKLQIPPMKFNVDTSSGREVIYRAFSVEDETTLLANLKARGIEVETAPSGSSSTVEGEFEWQASILTSESAFRTIAKIALIGFAHQFGQRSVESKAFGSIKAFIEDGSEGSPVRLFHSEEFRRATQAGPHRHMVLFAAIRKERVIWAIVMLFGGLTYLVKLRDCWEGIDLMKTYCDDAQKGEDCIVLPASLENELKAIPLVLDRKTIWNDIRASADAFIEGLRQASAAKAPSAQTDESKESAQK